MAQAVEMSKLNRQSTLAQAHPIDATDLLLYIMWQRSHQHTSPTPPAASPNPSPLCRVVSMEGLKSWARRFVKAPEHQVPTISTRDALNRFNRNPTPLVSLNRFLNPQNQLLSCFIGLSVPQVTLPNNPMGSQLQCGMAHGRLHRRSYGWNGPGPPRDVIC